MGLPERRVIFPIGMYCPQVHPQPVEKGLQHLDVFDRTSSHDLATRSI
jgi:hypothetical protein